MIGVDLEIGKIIVRNFLHQEKFSEYPHFEERISSLKKLRNKGKMDAEVPLI